MADRNLIFGLSLMLYGAVFSLGAYYMLGNVPLTALGIGLAVLGAAWALTPPNPLPKTSILSLVKSSCGNIEALLESLGAAERAVYLPLKDGRVIAYVPIRKGEAASLREVAEQADKIVIHRGGSLGVALNAPKISLGNPHPVDSQTLDVNSLLDYALVESEVASSVKAVVEEDAAALMIEKPKVDVDYARFRLVLGSLPSSIAAQTLALALSKPVQIIEEKPSGDRLIVRMKVLDWTDKTYT